jgi:hypothetical protein
VVDACLISRDKSTSNAIAIRSNESKVGVLVEKRTDSTSEQLEHRVKRHEGPSSTPTKEDLEAVAAKLLAIRWNAQQKKWDVFRHSRCK